MLSITVEHADFVVAHNRFWRRTESPQAFADLKAGRAVLVLKEGLTLKGRVIDRDGRPIAGARVSPVFPNRSAAATTDDRGRFELAHIAPGPIELTVQARGYVPAQRKVAAGEAAPVEIRLEAGRAVTGRLVDQANRPIAGALLQVEFGPSNRAIGPTAHTERDGRFRIEGVPFEGGNLVIRHGMNMTAQRVPPSGEDADLALTLKTSQVRLRITATDADSKRPIPAFTVVLRGYMMGRRPATDGRFELTLNRLPSRPGFPALQVLIEAEGYFPSGSRKVPTDHDEIDLAFALKRGVAIAGIVRAPTARPRTGRRSPCESLRSGSALTAPGCGTWASIRCLRRIGTATSRSRRKKAGSSWSPLIPSASPSIPSTRPPVGRRRRTRSSSGPGGGSKGSSRSMTIRPPGRGSRSAPRSAARFPASRSTGTPPRPRTTRGISSSSGCCRA